MNAHTLFEGRFTECMLGFKKKMIWEAMSQSQTQFLGSVNILTLHHLSLMLTAGLTVQIQALETSRPLVGD